MRLAFFLDLIGHIWTCVEIWPPAAIYQNIDQAKRGNVIHHLKDFNKLINFLKRSGVKYQQKWRYSLHQTSSPVSNKLNLVKLFSNFKVINKISCMGLKAATELVLENRCSEKPAILLKMNFFIGIFQGFWLQISPGNFRNSYF